MANQQSQFGFKHIGYLPGYAPDFGLAHSAIQSTFSTKIFYGDPVIKSASSPYVTLPANSTSASLAGIFVGCTFIPSTGGPPQWSPWFPGSVNADATAYLINSPGAKILAAAYQTAISTTNIGNNIGFTTGGLSGTASGGGVSIYTVDQGQISTSSLLPFQIVGLYPGVGNGSDPTTNYNWVELKFNNLGLTNATGIA
jgi:hypothetical protein